MGKLKIKNFIIILLVAFLVFSAKIRALEDGIYILKNYDDSSYYISINGKIQNESSIVLSKSNSYSKFVVRNLGNNTYTIKSYDDDSYSLDVPGGKKTRGINLQLYKYNGTAAQQWELKDAGDGYYYIFSKCNGLVIDVKFGEIKEKNDIWMYTENGTSAQKIKFERVDEDKEVLDSGSYLISSALNNDKVLGLSNGYKNESLIQLQDFENDISQFWNVDYIGNGKYTIKSFGDTNYSFDVPGSKKNRGINIQLYKYNGTSAQQWILKDVGDGYYNISSVASKLNLDVRFGLIDNGTPIWQYDNNVTNAQKFKFIKMDDVFQKYEKTVDDGYYFINTKLNSMKNLDNAGGRVQENNNVQLYSQNYTLAQKWNVQYVEDGYYKILYDNETYALSISDDNVVLAEYKKLNSQLWAIKKVGNYYNIISKSGKALSLNKNNDSNENNIIVRNRNDSDIQKFGFKKTAKGLSDKVIENGIYIISSALNNDYVLDLAGGSNKNGTNIQLYKTNGTNAQKWKVEYMSNGYYKITSLVDLNKSLDMAGGIIKSGANIQSYESNNTQAQQWLLKDAGDGYYYIISNCGGLYLDVSGGAHNSANIQLYDGNSTNAQKFKFRNSSKDTIVIDVSSHQGKIDWDKVNKSGVYGVILRIGSWTNEDTRFKEYLSEVKRLGIPYGIYLFSCASSDNGINKEIEFTKSMISKYDIKPTLGIYYDIEDWYTSPTDSSDLLSKDRYDVIIRTFIDSISSYVNHKYKVKVYANLYYANNKFNEYARSQIDWIAQYNKTCSYKGDYSLWQFTESGTLDGINGYVDMNYLY